MFHHYIPKNHERSFHNYGYHPEHISPFYQSYPSYHMTSYHDDMDDEYIQPHIRPTIRREPLYGYQPQPQPRSYQPRVTSAPIRPRVRIPRTSWYHEYEPQHELEHELEHEHEPELEVDRLQRLQEYLSLLNGYGDQQQQKLPQQQQQQQRRRQPMHEVKPRCTQLGRNGYGTRQMYGRDEHGYDRYMPPVQQEWDMDEQASRGHPSVDHHVPIRVIKITPPTETHDDDLYVSNVKPLPTVMPSRSRMLTFPSSSSPSDDPATATDQDLDLDRDSLSSLASLLRSNPTALRPLLLQLLPLYEPYLRDALKQDEEKSKQKDTYGSTDRTTGNNNNNMKMKSSNTSDEKSEFKSSSWNSMKRGDDDMKQTTTEPVLFKKMTPFKTRIITPVQEAATALEQSSAYSVPPASTTDTTTPVEPLPAPARKQQIYAYKVSKPAATTDTKPTGTGGVNKDQKDNSDKKSTSTATTNDKSSTTAAPAPVSSSSSARASTPASASSTTTTTAKTSNVDATYRPINIPIQEARPVESNKNTASSSTADVKMASNYVSGSASAPAPAPAPSVRSIPITNVRRHSPSVEIEDVPPTPIHRASTSTPFRERETVTPVSSDSASTSNSTSAPTAASNSTSNSTSTSAPSPSIIGPIVESEAEEIAIDAVSRSSPHTSASTSASTSTPTSTSASAVNDIDGSTTQTSSSDPESEMTTTHEHKYEHEDEHETPHEQHSPTHSDSSSTYSSIMHSPSGSPNFSSPTSPVPAQTQNQTQAESSPQQPQQQHAAHDSGSGSDHDWHITSPVISSTSLQQNEQTTTTTTTCEDVVMNLTIESDAYIVAITLPEHITKHDIRLSTEHDAIHVHSIDSPPMFTSGSVSLPSDADHEQLSAKSHLIAEQHVIVVKIPKRIQQQKQRTIRIE